MAKKILIVEDDIGSADILEEIARNKGYDASALVTIPDNAGSELEKELENGNPDIIICDGLVGKYVDVFNIAKEKNIPFVLYTGDYYRTEEERKNGNAAFKKPLENNELFKYLKEQLS